MSNKVDTKGKSLAEILCMRAEVQDRAEAKMGELTQARAEAYRRAEAEATPKMDAIVQPIIERELESVAPIQAGLDALIAEADALDDVIGPQLESGKVAIFYPVRSGDRHRDGLMTAFLDEDGDVTIAPSLIASTVRADFPPIAPPKADEDAGGRPAFLDKVVGAIREALGAEVSVTRVDVDHATGGLVCHCPKCRARRDAAASADPSPVVEDQASS